MMEALEKIEKDIKKPLWRSDKKNMDTLLVEYDKNNKKYANPYIFRLNNVISVSNFIRLLDLSDACLIIHGC